ncbi:Txe/YoeB family addiction module toxin [Vibrio mediterranei]|uniref:Txe/YoeB family addiction module toxin n=1 Tax=Vibrio mediterranei TaxID=689 RepID=UPI002284B16E|nr:Txe/YoeB family addiction module toxin [Vibrio mediterranei]MCY9855074.1 Txe/YoeB family addiction module toxin [Vibrio mediterranei]
MNSATKPWQTQDKKTLTRINKLINDVKRSPFEGVGKPEPLKENLSGFWSRRIDDTNRLVYTVDEQAITIISCRYHY